MNIFDILLNIHEYILPVSQEISLEHLQSSG